MTSFPQALANGLFGYESETAAARARLAEAIEAALIAAVRLDAAAARSRQRTIFERHEAFVGAIAAARVAGADVDLRSGFVHHVLDAASPDHRAARFLRPPSPADSRARRAAWRAAAQALAPGPRLLAAVSAVAAAAARARTRGHEHDAAAGDDYFDLGDLAGLTPRLLQRAGVVRRACPALIGQPRALAGRRPIEGARRWAAAVAEQAEAALARLEALEGFATIVDAKLAALRRPQAVRRAVDMALYDGATWAARLARQAGLDIANAWRSLGRAEALGLIVELPAPSRYRGDARVLVAVPVARALGLGPTPPRGVALRPRLSAMTDLSARLGDVDAATAAIDALLARSALVAPDGKDGG